MGRVLGGDVRRGRLLEGEDVRWERVLEGEDVRLEEGVRRRGR